MAPIHDTDLAEQRWTQAEWEHYELWERVELRLRRRKQLWILATAILFSLISAIPIVQNRWPKWTGISLNRKLAQEVNFLKKEANLQHGAFRLRFSPVGDLAYDIEKLQKCSDPRGTLVRSGSLLNGRPDDLKLLTPAQGDALGVGGLVTEFCYDALEGSQAAAKGSNVVGFGIASAKDLAEHRLDRVSVLLLTGPSAEISFD